MNIVKIGSEALIHHIDGFRVGVDLDIIGTYDDIIAHNTKLAEEMGTRIKSCVPFCDGEKVLTKFADGTIIEAEVAWDGTNQEQLIQLVMADPSTKLIDGYLVPSLDVLYMLKMSHRFRKNSPHFKKTMDDIILMRKHGADFFEPYLGWYDRRVEDTYRYHHPKLNVDKKDFFTDDVPYVYDHDTIHEVMKIGVKPAYQYYIEPNSEVMCSKELWNECSLDIKLNGVLEESYTLALERSQIPYPETLPDRSFEMALEKVCTSITSGWFREFAWDHYYEVMELYRRYETSLGSYVVRFKKGLDAGIVKPHK